MLCAMYGAQRLTQDLLDAKADINAKNSGGLTAADLRAQAAFNNTEKDDLLIQVREAQARGDTEEAKELLKAWKESRGVFS
mmetsp:Transcript_13591/g.24555  ORF Transcript_13591/g.24555 Transcript_13591/m.24555 type:complete len:81 (-) Transcript_13591:210-452(-)